MFNWIINQRMFFLDHLATRLGYVRRDQPREFARIFNGADAIARGHRWEQFYSEEGGLGDMIQGLRRSYFTKVGDLKPGEYEALRMLAIADRLVRELEREVLAVIESGKLAVNHRDHTARIATILK